MSQGSDDDVVVDVPRIQSMLDTAGAPLSINCCIYKVPPRLRDINKDAYTPKVVSIGPFHHGSPSLQNSEREKRIFLRKFIDRSNTNLDSLARFVEALEPDVRDYYSENTLSKAKLVEIILVDAGFILELFIWNKKRDWNEYDFQSLNAWLFVDVQQDLLLLENQLPFSILQKVFTFARPAYIRESLLDLTFYMFKFLNLQDVAPQTVADRGGPLHFIDLLRTFYLQPESDRLGRQPRKEELLYSVTELYEAGVKFKASESRCLLDLKFSDGVLEIPQLRVEDDTELLFRNMLALEQCHYLFDCYITDYIVILDYLINKESDVDFLVQKKKKIVRSWLGENNDVAKLFNSLGTNIYHQNLNSNYRELCENLNTFGGKSWRITRATFRRRYCNTRWKTAASIAASLILIFTLSQTVCSLYQVIHGDKAVPAAQKS